MLLSGDCWVTDLQFRLALPKMTTLTPGICFKDPILLRFDKMNDSLFRVRVIKVKIKYSSTHIRNVCFHYL